MGMAEYVIETENLVKVYRDRSGEVRALDGVTVRVPRGVLFGLFRPQRQREDDPDLDSGWSPAADERFG
jgi:hypothetical protein